MAGQPELRLDLRGAGAVPRLRPSPITLFYSRDGGETWSRAVAVSAGKFNQDAIPSVGPDGSVYVTYDGDTQLANGTTEVMIAKSTNGAASFTEHHVVTPMIDPVGRDLVNSDYRVGSYPASSVDGQGRVTVVWNDRRSGHSNVYVTRAWGSDLSSWTDPAALKASNNEQSFPWVSATASGRVDVVYYDRSRDPDNILNYVTYTQLQPTTDLDATITNFGDWSPAFNGNRDGGQLTTACTPFIGDYIGLSSDDAHVYLGWTGNGPSYQFNEFGDAVDCGVKDVLTVSIAP